MSGDLAFANPSAGGFDFRLEGGDLALSDGLLELVAHGLFRDGRASPAQMSAAGIPAGEDPRGHWSSALLAGAASSNPADGSLLWLLAREKLTPDMPVRIEQTLEKALAFLVEAEDGPGGPVQGIRARAARASVRGRIDAEITLFLSGSPKRSFAVVHDFVQGRYAIREVI